MTLPTDGPMDHSAKKKHWFGGRMTPAVMLMSIATAAIAQPPTDDWKEAELPTVKTPSGAPPDKAVEKIQQALDGDPLNSTGDGMLDDVLSVIKRRGSVLDGSVLDSQIDPLGDVAGENSTSLQSGKSASKRSSGPTETFRLAEQLLATARRLEKASQVSKTNRAPRIVSGDDLAKPHADMLPVETLVYQMRLRAVQLMQSGLNASRE